MTCQLYTSTEDSQMKAETWTDYKIEKKLFNIIYPINNKCKTPHTSFHLPASYHQVTTLETKHLRRYETFYHAR